MTNPLVLAATYNKRALKLTPDGGVDPDKLTRELGNIEQALKYAMNFVGAFFNVLDFGADPRGARDSTAAIQRAINACFAAGGGTVFAPPGTYLYTKISILAGVTLIAAGRGVTIFDRSALATGGSGSENLFGIRLAGSRAGLRHCSVKGIWDPATPTTQTYDLSVTIFGNDVQDCLVEDVESYNAHIGFLVGGVIADSVATYSGQSHNRFVGCYAHDTYDLGFGLVSKGTSDADTCIGNVVIDCWQHDSYATAGLEIRYQRAAQVVRFAARDNTNSSLGAGVRLEETSHARLTNIEATNCYMGLQVINDTTYCDTDGLTTRVCTYGAYFRHSARCAVRNVSLWSSGSDGVRLDYSDGTAWTNNNADIEVSGGIIDASGRSGFAYGVRVIGTGYTETDLEDNGLGLRVHGVLIRRTEGHGILIAAGGNFSVRGVVFDDNEGTGTDGVGIVIQNPNPNGVADTAKPAGGIVDDCTFITTGLQPTMTGDTTGSTGLRLTTYGRLHSIGGGTVSSSANPYEGSTQSVGTVSHLGLNVASKVIAAADSPYTVQPRDVFLRGNATAGAITVNLPTAVGRAGAMYIVKKSDASANAVTVTPNGAETIDGAATFPLPAQWDAVMVQSDGTNWMVLATV